MFDTIPWQGASACLLAVSWQQKASGGTYQPRGSPKAALPLSPSPPLLGTSVYVGKSPCEKPFKDPPPFLQDVQGRLKRCLQKPCHAAAPFPRIVGNFSFGRRCCKGLFKQSPLSPRLFGISKNMSVEDFSRNHPLPQDCQRISSLVKDSATSLRESS